MATGRKESGSTPPPAPTFVLPAEVQHGGAVRIQNLTGDAGVIELE
jgi:hypothetical protein